MLAALSMGWNSFYVNKINLELRDSKYYKVYNLEVSTIINKFSAFAKKCRNLFSKLFSVENGGKLPFFFMTPKFHKNPVKFRFICSTVNSIKSYNTI